MKIEKRWVISFILVATVAILGLFWKNSNDLASEFTTEAKINYADVAWLLTSSSFVLLMTLDLSFFYGGMVGKKM